MGDFLKKGDEMLTAREPLFWERLFVRKAEIVSVGFEKASPGWSADAELAPRNAATSTAPCCGWIF